MAVPTGEFASGLLTAECHHCHRWYPMGADCPCGGESVIERSRDAWRSRCLLAEKKNREYLAELAVVRDELMEARYGR